MTRQVNIYEAKTHFSRLVDEVARGETIIVARNNVPLVEMRPIARDNAEVVQRFRNLRESVRKHNAGRSVLRPGETWRDLIEEGREK